MIRYTILLLSILFSTNSIYSQFSISGSSESPYDYKNEIGGGSGLDHIYLLKNLSGVTLIYESTSNAVQFYKYSTSSSNKTPIPSSEINTTYSGGTTIYEISNIEGDRGYSAELTGASKFNIVWVADYSKYIETFNSLNINENTTDKCEYISFIFEKTTLPIEFYDYDGTKREMKRKHTITYDDATWDSSKNEYIKKEKTESFAEPFRIKAPIVSTNFQVSGDQFAQYFNIAQTIHSQEYEAHRIEANLETEVGENTSSGDGNEYDAPVEINFYSNASEAANHYKWKIFHNTPSENSDDYMLIRYTEDLSYTFTAAGTYTVKLEVSNQNSDCVPIEKESSFSISISSLAFPNFLSPGSSTEGVPHMFKASYRSIIRFKCTIFNRWGNKIYEWTDPDGGWDGTSNGKVVSPGVYFYVVDAEGSDGKPYKKGADINVLHGSNNTFE